MRLALRVTMLAAQQNRETLGSAERDPSREDGMADQLVDRLLEDADFKALLVDKLQSLSAVGGTSDSSPIDAAR